MEQKVTSLGCEDTGVPNAIWVMEFKYDKDAQTALRQIDEKGYLVPFAADGTHTVEAVMRLA